METNVNVSFHMPSELKGPVYELDCEFLHPFPSTTVADTELKNHCVFASLPKEITYLKHTL